MDPELMMKILMSAALGALIGIERQRGQQDEAFSGIRTFVLISIFGTISTLLAIEYSRFILVTSIGSLCLLVGLGYVVTAYFGKGIGFTTEIATIIVFLIGVMVATDKFMSLAVVVAIITTGILALKKPLHRIARNIKEDELFDTLKFGVIAFIILPLLPNRNLNIFYGDYSGLNVFNPYKLWLMVVFISGIGFIGYFLMKIFGASKGLTLTGFLGGLVSSTAVTSTMAIQAKENNKIALAAVVATVVASTTMFFRVAIEVIVVNIALLPYLLLPLGGMAAVGLMACLYLYRKSVAVESTAEIQLTSPFTLGPALKFGLLFLAVLFFSKLFYMEYQSTGLYIASILSGLADVDAITLSVSSQAATKSIDEITAVRAIILAIISNTVVKSAIARNLSSKVFGKWITIVFGSMILTGLVLVAM